MAQKQINYTAAAEQIEALQKNLEGIEKPNEFERSAAIRCKTLARSLRQSHAARNGDAKTAKELEQSIADAVKTSQAERAGGTSAPEPAAE